MALTTVNFSVKELYLVDGKRCDDVRFLVYDARFSSRAAQIGLNLHIRMDMASTSHINTSRVLVLYAVCYAEAYLTPARVLCTKIYVGFTDTAEM